MAEEVIFEITFCEAGRIFYWSRSTCEEYFGRDEFLEIEQGYDPTIVAVQVSNP